MYDIGKKLIAVFVSLLLVVPTAAFAIPVSVNRLNNNHIEPLNQADFIRGVYFVATSTTGASTFPYASTTALSATTICLIGDVCRTSWPSGSASTFGTTSISALAPLIWDTTLAQMSWTGLATTSQPSSSNVLVSDGASGVFGVATGTVSGSGGVTVTSGRSVLGGSLTVTCTAGSGSATGCIQSADWTVFNNKISSSSLSALTPIFYNSSTGVFSWAGLATTSQPSSSNLLVSNGGAGVFGVATSTLSASAPLTGSLVQIGSGGSLGCTTASNTAAGCITAANHALFSLSRIATGSAETKGNLAFWLTTAGSPPLLGSVATGTIAGSGGITVTANQFIIGSGLTVTCTAASGSATGCISSSDWTKFNMKVATGSAETRGQLAYWGTTGGSPATLNSVATTSLAVSSAFSHSGTLGALVGGSAGTLSSVQTPAFTFATTTAWGGTTTIPLGPAFYAETWNSVKCFTDTGTLWLAFDDGTNVMNYVQASTTVNTVALSTNNSYTAGEKRYVKIGNPASSPTTISCTVNKTI